MNPEMRAVAAAVIRAVLWTAVSLILGSIPVSIGAIIGLWTEKSFVEFAELLRNGLAIGLVLALVGAVCIDQIFSKTAKVESLAEKLFFFVLPGFFIGISVVSFTIITLAPDRLNFSSAATFYKYVLSGCLVFCLVAKYLHFYAPESKSKPLQK